MGTEEILDDTTRANILSQLLTKKVDVEDNNVNNLDNIPTNNSFNFNLPKDKKVLCKHCGHKIWHDGDEWQHSGKEHHINCYCTTPVPFNEAFNNIDIKQEEKKQDNPESVTQPKFDSTTPANELLAAVVQNKLKEDNAKKEKAKILDKKRQYIIERINDRGAKILKDWKF